MIKQNRCFLSPFLVAVLTVLLTCFSAALVGFYAWRLIPHLPPTNVLILGLDRRPDQGYAVRSDTIILTAVDPGAPRVALLSIPRDLYVDIPRHGKSRINAAHFFGEREMERGGPTLAMQTVAQNFEVPVHRYVRADFDGFRALVDAVGGVDIVVEEPIVDNTYPTEHYRTMRIEIPSGLQHMDGETTLRYVRSRHSSSDFDRARRQQQVLSALVRQFLAPDNWRRWPTAYMIAVDDFDTDLSVGDLVVLVSALLQVGPDGIEHLEIDHSFTTPWTTPSGGAVLLPRWEAIRSLVGDVFDS